MNYFPRDLVLDQKEERMEFNKHAIVIGETMNGEQVFRGMWNMEDIMKMKILSRSTNN
jgi:hypothetical protein